MLASSHSPNAVRTRISRTISAQDEVRCAQNAKGGSESDLSIARRLLTSEPAPGRLLLEGCPLLIFRRDLNPRQCECKHFAMTT